MSWILNILENDMKVILLWFKVNLFTASLGKFQFMIFGNKSRKKYCLKIASIFIKEPYEVKCLGKTFDKVISFK